MHDITSVQQWRRRQRSRVFDRYGRCAEGGPLRQLWAWCNNGRQNVQKTRLASWVIIGQRTQIPPPLLSACTKAHSVCETTTITKMIIYMGTRNYGWRLRYVDVVLRCVSYVSLLMLITFRVFIVDRVFGQHSAALQTANIDRGHNVSKNRPMKQRTKLVAALFCSCCCYIDGMTNWYTLLNP